MKKPTKLFLQWIWVLPLLIWFMLTITAPSGEKHTSVTSSFEVEETTEGKHTLFIASPGFTGTEEGLTIFFDDLTIVNNRIKVILDGEVYWISLEGR